MERKIKVQLYGDGSEQEILASWINPGEWFKKRWLILF